MGTLEMATLEMATLEIDTLEMGTLVMGTLVMSTLETVTLETATPAAPMTSSSSNIIVELASTAVSRYGLPRRTTHCRIPRDRRLIGQGRRLWTSEPWWPKR